MKVLLGILIIIAILLGAKELFSYWQKVDREHQAGEASRTGRVVEQTATGPEAEVLPGLPPQLESSLEAARRQGHAALRVWLNEHRAQVRDPRLGAIELDYVVLVAGRDFGEAREVFASVKARTPKDSPVYPRIQKMQKTYE